MLPPFARVGGDLIWQGLNLADAIARFGTPTLLYSADRFANNAKWLVDGFEGTSQTIRIAYALKACSHVQLAKVARACGLWCEVMSGPEYELARCAGFSPETIIVNGLGWDETFVRRAVSEQAALINVDNAIDLERVAAAARQAGTRPSVGIRVVPDLPGLFAPSGGKLGAAITSGDAERLFAVAASLPELRCVALHAHGCHRATDPVCWARLANSIADFALSMQERYDLRLEVLDFGGGLDDRASLEAGGWRAADFCLPLASAAGRLGPDVRVLIEPGRFLVGDAAIGLCEVRVAKTSLGRQWLIVDLGTNVLIPIPAAHYETYALEDHGGSCSSYSIADGICSPASILQENKSLPAGIQAGKKLAIANCGSYTLTMGENWGYHLPAVILAEKGEWRILLSRNAAQRLFLWVNGASDT